MLRSNETSQPKLAGQVVHDGASRSAPLTPGCRRRSIYEVKKLEDVCVGYVQENSGRSIKLEDLSQASLHLRDLIIIRAGPMWWS